MLFGQLLALLLELHLPSVSRLQLLPKPRNLGVAIGHAGDGLLLKAVQVLTERVLERRIEVPGLVGRLRGSIPPELLLEPSRDALHVLVLRRRLGTLGIEGPALLAGILVERLPLLRGQ